MIEWSDCSCCWPQKPRIYKAVGWKVLGGEGEPDTPIDPFWCVEVGGWPEGYCTTWELALAWALRYLERGN